MALAGDILPAEAKTVDFVVGDMSEPLEGVDENRLQRPVQPAVEMRVDMGQEIELVPVDVPRESQCDEYAERHRNATTHRFGSGKRCEKSGAWRCLGQRRLRRHRPSLPAADKPCRHDASVREATRVRECLRAGFGSPR